MALRSRSLEEGFEEAKQAFSQALALHQSGELEGARALYERALALAPGRASVMNNLAALFLQQGKFPEARRLCERVLECDPADETALVNLGRCQVRMNAAEEALITCDRVLALKPGSPEALYNRGDALRRLGRLDEALAGYDRVLAGAPGHLGALNNRCVVLAELNRREDLVAAYQRLLDVAPDHPYAQGHLLNAKLQCCDWSGYDEGVAGIAAAVGAGRPADYPFDFLAISNSASDQLQCARTCAGDEYRQVPDALWRGERYPHEKIRLAYVSADFHGHAMSYLLAGLYEAHDRSRFEVTAISIGPDRSDAMRARLMAGFDRFIDVRGDDDRKVAALLRDLEIDIAIDLQGYTFGCRPGIFAHRPTPVQVNYLGYPGTMGAPYMDYIIADRWVIPEELQSCYSEKVVYLPDCYQVNDNKRRVAPRTPARGELGLPDRAFVFCCFNNNYKISPHVFAIWTHLLNRVPGSVLWLLEDNAVAGRNVRGEAARKGIAAERLVFAPRVPMEEHLARQRQADLFLDTLPYNAHVTASDALWVGLPIVTRLGSTFAGRVAASLLNAIGLGELVTRTGEEYEEMACRLATTPALLESYRSRLSMNRSTHPLFDTDRFRHHIEAAYVTMWKRYQRGEPPVQFEVPALEPGGAR